MEFMGQKIVITGATGFIGRNVARALLERGAQVYALVRAGSPNRALLPDDSDLPGELHLVEGSLEQVLESVGRIGQADVFLHFAWGGVNREEIDSPAVQAANVTASLCCVEAAHRLGCRIFLDAGSRVEYGIADQGIMTETLECHPVNAYGKAKLAFYQQAKPLCRQWEMTYYHLRFFSVYGTGDHPWSIISTLVRELPKGGTVSLSACWHDWNFMDIEDAAQAVVQLILQSKSRQGESRIVNIASADTRVLQSFVEEVQGLCGKKGTLEFGAFVQAKEGALSIRPTIDELVRLTDGHWKEQYSFAQGIQKMLSAEEMKIRGKDR